ncbi:MAG: PilW family protein [Solirubrobacteraceae bacterium]
MHRRMPHGTPTLAAASAAGYTLIELLISMALAIVVTLAAFAILDFTTNDVSRVTERVHVDQAGRLSMERLMLELHSACVTPEVAPILTGSKSESLKFISKAGTENSFSQIEEHEIVYTPPKTGAVGTLVEKSWPSSTFTAGPPPSYTWNTASETKMKLLTGVKQSVTEEAPVESIPVFRYYRYYDSSDASPKYGAINPTPIGVPLTEADAARVVKVAVSFTVTPEGTEASAFNHDRPAPFEDSAILRLTPASESSTVTNSPCGE